MSAIPAQSVVLDGYRLVRFLGRGGFGEVWLCQSEAIGGYHALKFIPEKNAELLEKEYQSLALYRRAAAKLRSPHLVSIDHINRHEAGLYYVMPLADGISGLDPAEPCWQPLSLATRIDQQRECPRWFSSRDIIGLMTPLLDALQTLSDAGLVHRDVKPENILFFDGSPSLGDISLLGEDAAVITRRGTPGYATPSWYRGGHPDMHGAAATLYTLLTGNPPDKMGRAAFLWPPQGETSLPEAEQSEWKRLHAVIRRATEEEVGERYVDFRAMAAALAGIGTPALLPSIPSAPLPPLPTKDPADHGRPKAPRGMAALLVICVGGIVLATRGGQEKSPAPPPQITFSPATPVAPHDRKPRVVDAQGHFKTLRERVIEAIPAAISLPSNDDEPIRLDLSDYADRSAILKTYQSRDYSQCLDLLNSRIANQPALLKNPLTFLFKALILKRLDRESGMRETINDYRRLPEVAQAASGLADSTCGMRITLLEALDLFTEAESCATNAVEAARANLLRSDRQPAAQDSLGAVLLYRDRARIRILQGDLAGALADEHAALELPPDLASETSDQTAEEDQQNHLNTIVREWWLLELEFPDYADYLAARGHPEPKPDRRDLRAAD